jgi:hypothetical protein
MIRCCECRHLKGECVCMTVEQAAGDLAEISGALLGCITHLPEHAKYLGELSTRANKIRIALREGRL